MGVSCVNFHAYSVDEKAVAKALTRIVHVEALVAPAKNGWISFFDESASSQDTKQLVRIARALSKKLGTAVFGFLVHDSDIFQYQLFENGKLLDQFDSRPDYFGVVSSAKRRKLAGHPEALLRWARAGVTVADIRSVLSGSADMRVEEERAAAFAELFNIDRGLACADFKDIDDDREAFRSVLSKASPLARALSEAAISGDVAAVRAVLELGASPNIEFGYEPLLVAQIKNENLEMVSILREFGAKAEITLEDGSKLEWHVAAAVSQAVHTGRMEILEFLLTEPIPPSQPALAHALCSAVSGGSTEIVERLLKAGADVNVLGGGSSLALAHAVKRGYSRFTARLPKAPAPTDWERMVQVLLDAGADVNRCQSDGFTPLMAAAVNDELEFVEKLLALGADPNARLESGLTALMLASSSGHRRIVDILSPVTKVQRRQSPGSLWAAASAGDLAGVESALASGISPNALAGRDMNPLLAAAQNKHGDIVARLLQAGANPNFSTKYNGITALWFAQAYRDETMVKLLIDAGAIDRNEAKKKRSGP